MNISFSIKTKIFLVTIIPALLLLFVIYLDYGHLNSLGRSAELILSKNYKSIKAAQQIRQYLKVRQNKILTTLFMDKKPEPQDLAYHQKISELLDFCRNNITEQGEKDIIANLFGTFENFKRIDNQLITTVDPCGKARSNQRYYDFIAVTAALIADLNHLVLINEKAMETAEQETKQVAGQALRYSMGLLIFALLFTPVFSYILSLRIARPLTELAQSLESIKEGSGVYPHFPVRTRDEIGFLTSEFNRLFERLEVFDQLSADKLTAERRKVRRAEEAKARFIADLSHQLKTPMTSLSMSVGIMAEKADRIVEGKYANLVETAREDCVRLSALINELVDIARLDGMMKSRPRERLIMERVMHECLKPLLYQAEEKNIDILVDVEADLPSIAIDSLRFPWVITNLVGNAIRYTGRGGRIVLRVEKRGGRCYFQCIDKGSGIEEKYLAKIFDRYTQFSERVEGGAIGLGLAIVKEIIEAHGGDIYVESKVGDGTTFTFWVPIQVGEAVK